MKYKEFVSRSYTVWKTYGRCQDWNSLIAPRRFKCEMCMMFEDELSRPDATVEQFAFPFASPGLNMSLVESTQSVSVPSEVQNESSVGEADQSPPPVEDQTSHEVQTVEEVVQPQEVQTGEQ